jgi:PAS domain S-box-containing protein
MRLELQRRCADVERSPLDWAIDEASGSISGREEPRILGCCRLRDWLDPSERRVAFAGTGVSDTNRQQDGMPLQAFLTRLIWLCMWPLLLLAAYLEVDNVRAVQAENNVKAAHVLKIVADAVDQDLKSRIGALQLLASSPLADDPSRWRDLYREAQGFQQSFGSHIILADLDKRIRLSTRVPFGDPLPMLPLPKGHSAVSMALDTGKPAVGDAFVGPIAKESMVAIAVPVKRDGKTAFLLLTTFETRQFQRHLEEIALPAGWAVSLLDGSGDLIARRAPAGLNSATDVDASGRFVVHSAASSWTVMLEISRADYRAPLLAAALTGLIAILGATLAGVVGGTLASRKLGGWVASLARAPRQEAASAGIAEISAVRRLLDEAARRREAIETTLRQSEQRFRRLFQESPIPLALVSKDSAVADVNVRFEQAMGYTLEDIPTLADWWRRAYPEPDERATATADWDAANSQLATAPALLGATERRVTCKSGAVREMVVSGIGIGDEFLVTFFDVTERKRAEEALRQSTALYQHTLDNMLEGCQIIGFDWRYRYLNTAGALQNRQPSDALIGRTMMEVYAGIETTEVFAVLQRCMSERVAQHTETEFVFPDDSRGWFDVNAQPVPEGIAIFSVDVTERKRTGEARQLLSAIVESSDDAIIGKSLKGIITAWNPGAERLFGYRVEEALGQPLLMLVPPERGDEESDILARIARGESVHHFETVRVRKDGQRVNISATISPIHDAQGRVVGASKIARDITERKLAEARMQAQLECLSLLDRITCAIGERQDLQSIYQVVIRSLEDQLPADFSCICSHDPVGNTLTVLRVGVRTPAFSVEEHARIDVDQNGLSRCVSGELVYEPDISANEFALTQRLAASGLRALVAAPLHSEGRVFGVLMVARRQANAFSSGECEFLRQLCAHVGVAAQQAQLYGALQQAYDELRQTQQAVMQHERLRALGQMASGIAHDINNAISPVLLYTETLLEREPGLSERARGYLEIIARSMDDVAATVARLREFYRHGEPQLTFMSVDMNLLVAQVVELTRARWSDMPQERGVVIRMIADLAPGLPAVRGVESELREALINLVFNAVDAMPDGGDVVLRTSCNTGPESGGKVTRPDVHVDVVDTGIGMNDDTRHRCLDPFFTTKGERGTGLGLAMVYGIAQRHGAAIDVISAVGQGTRVRLSFPVPESATMASPVTIVSQMPTSQLHILIVDDDPIVLKSLCDTLETEGHAVVIANGGQDGIDAFRAARESTHAFDIVITDLGMPYIDGRQVASAVKQGALTTPVIMLTGWGQRLVADGEMPAHVDALLSKPPKLIELRAALARLTGNFDSRAVT